MADLHLSYPKLNPYFRDARIRRCLLNAGLINRHGDILPSSTAEETRPRSARRPPANKSASVRRVNSRSRANVHRETQAGNEKRPKSAHTRRPTTSRKPPSPPPPPKQLCRLTMRYLKSPTKVDYDVSWLPQKGDEILIMQQHCGGENLTVFKSFVEPGGKFAFDSQRHADYPFALAFYINGLIDSRISVCCEYRHKKNIPLAGPSGLFAIVKVDQVTPCRSCRLLRLKKKGQATLSLGLEPGRYRRSVIPNPTNNTRSPSLPRPQSPVPPLELNEQKSPARRPSKKKMTKIPTPPSSLSSRGSIEPTEADERTPTDLKFTPESDEKQSPVTKPDRSLSRESAEKSPPSTPVFDQKSPVVSDDQKQTAVSPKIEESSDETEISLPHQPSRDQELSSMDLNEANSTSKKDRNYSPDFDEEPPTNTPFNQPRSSDSQSNNSENENAPFEALDDSDYPSKSTLKKTISSDSSDRQSSDLFEEKKPRDAPPSPVETRPKTARTRRTSSNSSDDFLGIKRASPRAATKAVRNLEEDFFESEYRNEQVNGDSKTKSWRDDTFFD